MRQRLRIATLGLATILLTHPTPSAMAADTAPGAMVGHPATLSARAGQLLSCQPGGYEGPGSPYLSKNLGGTRAGLSLALQRWRGGQPLVAVEVSTTLPFEAVQSSRVDRAWCWPGRGKATTFITTRRATSP